MKALAVGEGDADNVYVKFRFCCDQETTLREEVWLYQRIGNEWKAKSQVPNNSLGAEVIK